MVVERSTEEPELGGFPATLARRLLAPGWFEALLAISSLLVSAPRVARDVVLMGNSAPLIAAASVWGVPAAPGHAVYTFIGHLATQLPFGNVAVRMHATSAVYHAVCVALAALMARRLTGARAAAVATALVLTFSPTFLLGSLYAEVQPLTDALFALVLLSSCGAAQASPEARFRWLLAVAIALGCALAHSPWTLLSVPAVSAFVARPMRQELRAQMRHGLYLLLGLLAPILASLALLWLAASRDSVISSGDVHDLRTLLSLASSGVFDPLSSSSPAAIDSASERVGALVLLLGRGVGPFSLLTAVAGVLGLVFVHRTASVGLLLAFVFTGPLLAAGVSTSLEGEVAHASFARLFGMAHVPVAVLSGVGVVVLARRATPRSKLSAAIGAALAAIIGLALWPASLGVDLSRDTYGRALVRDLLWNVPDGALVLVSGDRFTAAAQYACVVERACDRVTVLVPGRLFVPWERAQVERRHPDLTLPVGKMSLTRTDEIVAAELPRRPVFLVPTLMLRDRDLSRRFSLQQAGLLLRAFSSRDAAGRARPESEAWLRALADGRQCAGCQLGPSTAFRPSEHIRVLMAYSVMFENAGQLARRHGLDAESELFFARARELDAAIGFDLLRLRGAPSVE